MTAFANVLKSTNLSVSERQLTLSGLARGAVLFIGFTLGMALLSGVIAITFELANLDLPVALDLELGLLSGFAAAISAAAMTPNLLASSLDGSVNYFDVLGAIPILAWLMYVVLSGIGKEFALGKKVSSSRQIWILALSVATGFIGLASISSLGLAASHSNVFFSTSLESVSLGDAAISGFFISSVVAWAANQKRRELAGMPTGIGNLLGRFFGTLMAAWSTLIVLAVIYLLLFFWMEPDFAEAVGAQEPVPSTFSSNEAAAALAALLVVFILAPALVFYFFAITMGASFSLEASSGSLDLADLMGNVTAFLPGGIGNEFSIFQISQFAGVGLILMAFFVSIFAATAASVKTGFAITKKHEIFTSLGFVATVLFFLSHFFGFGVDSTNRGSLPEDLAGGGVPLIEERVLIGVAVGGLTLLWLVIATGLYLGAGPFRETFAGAYPGLMTLFGARRLEVPEERLSSRILSIVSIAVLAAATTVPMTIAATERVWASIDNPVQLADKLFEEYQTAEISTLKEFTTSTNPWLSETALSAARENGETPVSSTTLNNIGEKWKVGDIEVVTSYLVGEEDQSFTVDITNSGSVRSYWEIDHPQFKTRLVPGLITFTGPDELKAKEEFSFTVNGEKASFGTFQAIPGTYRVESNELGMISAINHTFRVSSDQTLEIDFSEYLSIPDQAQTQIETTLNGIKTGCSNIDNLTSGDCPTKQQFNDALQRTGDREVNGGVLYLELKVSDWESVGLTVTDQSVDFSQQCTAIRTEVTALASSLPDSVEPSLFSSVSWTECDYSYSLTRTFEDANDNTYPMDLFGQSTFLYYIEGKVSEESGEFTASRIKIQDKTEYPE